MCLCTEVRWNLVKQLAKASQGILDTFPPIAWKNAMLDGYCQFFCSLVQHLWRQMLLGQAPIDAGCFRLRSKKCDMYCGIVCTHFIFKQITYKMLAGSQMLSSSCIATQLWKQT